MRAIRDILAQFFCSAEYLLFESKYAQLRITARALALAATQTTKTLIRSLSSKERANDTLITRGATRDSSYPLVCMPVSAERIAWRSSNNAVIFASSEIWRGNVVPGQHQPRNVVRHFRDTSPSLHPTNKFRNPVLVRFSCVARILLKTTMRAFIQKNRSRH